MAAAVAKRGLDEDIESVTADAPEELDTSDSKGKKVKEKKEKKAKKEKPKKEKGGKGGALKIIIPVILLLIIGAVAAVVVLNPLGLRDKYLNGIVSKIPIVKNVIKEDAAAAPEVAREELESQITRLTGQVSSLTNTNEALVADVANYKKEVSRLKEFEDAKLAFNAEKEAFDKEVALADPVEYEKYYEDIDPVNAEKLYSEAVGINVSNKELRNFINTYNDMDEAQAAPILETLSMTDMDLVVLILKGISTEQRAAILGAMAPETAASITKMMSPQQ